MTSLKTYKDLIVWQKAVELVKEVYGISKKLPSYERFILISQMLRAVISIPSNIAEGWSRNHKAEYVRFLYIAYASSTELETQLLIAKQQYPNIDYNKAEGLLLEIHKMLLTLIKSIKIKPITW